jgi:radical SAM protein with 4Fe4S-binding SPASM domain
MKHNSTAINFPKLSDDIFAKTVDSRVLYLNPKVPDWITINVKYKSFFDLFDGCNSIDSITKHIKKNYSEESELLVNQISNLINDSKIFTHNSIPKKQKGNKESGTLKSVYLTLTDDCNLKCKYCYTKGRIRTKTSDLSQWKAYIDKVLSISKPLKFTFTGGEPLLVPFLFDLAKYIHERGSESLLLTNGLCIANKAIAKKISKYFTQTRISLDSIHEENSTYLRGPEVLEKVESAVSLLDKAKAEIILQATVTQINKDEVAEFAAHFKNRVNFQPLYQMGSAKDYTELTISGMEYYQALSQAGIYGFRRNIHNYKCNPCKRCSMGIEELSIAPNGDLYPCHMLHYPEFRIGNLNEDDIHKLYYESPLLEDLRNINVDNIKQCKICEVRNFCGGGCRARIDFKTSGLKGNDPFCVFEKESILEALMYSFG